MRLFDEKQFPGYKHRTTLKGAAESFDSRFCRTRIFKIASSLRNNTSMDSSSGSSSRRRSSTSREEEKKEEDSYNGSESDKEEDEERRRPKKKQRLDVKNEEILVMLKHDKKNTRRGLKRVASNLDLKEENEGEKGEEDDDDGDMEQSSSSQKGEYCSFQPPPPSSCATHKRHRTSERFVGTTDFAEYAEGISRDFDEEDDDDDDDTSYRNDGEGEYENSDDDDISSTSYSDTIFEVFGWGKQEPIDMTALESSCEINFLQHHKKEIKTKKRNSSGDDGDHVSSASKVSQKGSYSSSDNSSSSSSSSSNPCRGGISKHKAAELNWRAAACSRTRRSNRSNTKQQSFTTTPIWLQDRSLTPRSRKNNTSGGRSKEISTGIKKCMTHQTVSNINVKMPTSKKTKSGSKKKKRKHLSSSRSNGVGSKSKSSTRLLVSNLKRLKVGKMRGNL